MTVENFFNEGDRVEVNSRYEGTPDDGDEWKTGVVTLEGWIGDDGEGGTYQKTIIVKLDGGSTVFRNSINNDGKYIRKA